MRQLIARIDARRDKAFERRPQSSVSLLYATRALCFAPTSPDEPEHAELRSMLLEGEEAMVTTELSRMELANAARAAAKGGRLRSWGALLARIDADCQEDGPIALLRLRPEVVLPVAYGLVLERRLRMLDAIHLAVAAEDCPALAGDDDIAFVTRDRDQASAAAAAGGARR